MAGDERDDSKKINTKYLWIYTIVLFAIAGVLVLITSIQQGRANDSIEQYAQQLTEQKTFCDGIQKSLEDILEENAFLQTQLEGEHARAETLEKQLLDANGKLAEQRQVLGEQEKMIEAQELYIQRKYSEAKEKLEAMDMSVLREELAKQREDLYDKVKKA